MKTTETFISDLYIIEPNVYKDRRGYFFEQFNQNQFDSKIGKVNFVQDNESKSERGVLRGFHFQLPPFEQSKLVRCVVGEVLDIALDIRKKSKTYGQYKKVVLSGNNKKQFFIPKGFAHAFLVLSEYAIINYKVDNIYAPDYDSGVIWDDPYLGIDWGLDSSKIIISKKDKNLDYFKSLNSPF